MGPTWSENRDDYIRINGTLHHVNDVPSPSDLADEEPDEEEQ